MKKLDARQLDHKTREEIRIRAVQRVLDGESPEQVIKALGHHRSNIYGSPLFCVGNDNVIGGYRKR